MCKVIINSQALLNCGIYIVLFAFLCVEIICNFVLFTVSEIRNNA